MSVSPGILSQIPLSRSPLPGKPCHSEGRFRPEESLFPQRGFTFRLVLRAAPCRRTRTTLQSSLEKSLEKASVRCLRSHIATVHDVFEREGEIFLVMERIQGQTLRQRLGDPMEIDEFSVLAVQCAERLSAARDREFQEMVGAITVKRAPQCRNV